MQVETSRESLDALKRAAEAAMAFTAETWRASPNAFGVLNTVDMGTPPTSPFIVVHSDCGGHGAVIAFIVAAQPSAVMALLAERDAAIAERDALRDEWEEIAAGITTEQPEVGALWPMVSEELGTLSAVRNHFKNEVAAHNRTKAERDRMREALEIIAGYRQCMDNLMSNVDVARAALTSAKEPSA